jgi:hypothetical protein
MFYVVITGMKVRHIDNFISAFILLYPFHRLLAEDQSSPETSCILTVSQTINSIQHNCGGKTT